MVTLGLLILPLLDGVEEAIGVGVVVTELVTDAVVGVGVDVVDWDSQRVRRFIICGDIPGRFLVAMSNSIGGREEGERGAREREREREECCGINRKLDCLTITCALQGAK